MKLGSLFAGVGGFDCAASRVGISHAWQVEIDRQCRSVLERHFPGAMLCDDVRTMNANGIELRPDIISAGWPCQGNSVAGQRAGMADERSGLWSEVVRILREFRPRWFLGENVPGILSVHGGRDFASVLWDLAKLGYGFAYRILDAQHFGLAQRRRRVFIVGCLGNWRRAGEVLFDAESLPGHSPPRGETRERVAATITAGVASGRGVNRHGRRREEDVNLVAGTLMSKDGRGVHSDMDTNLLPVVAKCLNSGRDGYNDGSDQTYLPIAFDTTQITSPGNYSRPSAGDACHPIAAGAHAPAVAFQTRIARNGRGQPKDITDALTSSEGGTHADSKPHVAGAFGVRRLTPLECERLQGFPDGWTRYAADGSELSDSARYRMLGNAVAVPVVEWILERIVTHARTQAPRQPIANRNGACHGGNEAGG